MRLLRKVWKFFLNPKYQKYNYPKTLRRRIFLNLLLWNVLIALILGSIVSGLTEILNLDIGENEIAKMFELYSPLFVFFIAIIIAPLLEESLFRGPLIFFRRSKYFKPILYISIFLFGFIHLFNFESYENAIWFAPLLFLPQLITGIFLSFIRVRMGLAYAMLYHALFNFCLLGPFILFELFKPIFH